MIIIIKDNINNIIINCFSEAHVLCILQSSRESPPLIIFTIKRPYFFYFQSEFLIHFNLINIFDFPQCTRYAVISGYFLSAVMIPVINLHVRKWISLSIE